MNKHCAYCGCVLVKNENEANYRFKKRVYCNVKCRRKGAGLKRRDKDVDKYLRMCKHCGKPYKRRPKEKPYQYRRRRYCSNACKLAVLPKYSKGKIAHNNKQVEATCKWCGKTRMVAPCLASRSYCGRDCMKAHFSSGIKAGENHHNWQGGITEDAGRDVLYPGYKDWRRAVFKRDGFRCQICGDCSSGTLRAHHVRARADHLDLVCDVDNGITLCHDCHQGVHYGKLKDVRFVLWRDYYPSRETTEWEVQGA